MQARLLSLAECIRVIDGDTILARLTCPCCKITSEQRVRIARIDAPELKGPHRAAALAAKRHLAAAIEGKTISVAVRKAWPDRYGRVIAEVYLGSICMAEYMISAGHASYYAPAK